MRPFDHNGASTHVHMSQQLMWKCQKNWFMKNFVIKFKEKKKKEKLKVM